MSRDTAEKLLRGVLAQLNVPLQKHQELQEAVTVLASNPPPKIMEPPKVEAVVQK